MAQRMDTSIIPTYARGSLGLFQLSQISEAVIDADEEIFLLYTSLQNYSITRPYELHGLGHVDSRVDTLALTLELPSLNAKCTVHSKKAKAKKRREVHTLSKSVEVILAQDKTALRTRRGDTGSVLWKASAEFARLVLKRCHSQCSDSLFVASKFQEAHVLELGAGTGFLSIALSPLVRLYTVTDVPDLVPLIHKNLALNLTNNGKARASNVTVAALDWTLLHSSNGTTRHRVFPLPEPADSYDLILVVDCIYNPFLFPSLLSTMEHVAGSAPVLVIVELRSADVLREFLEKWLHAGWKIWRLGGMIEIPYAAWIGLKPFVGT